MASQSFKWQSKSMPLSSFLTKVLLKSSGSNWKQENLINVQIIHIKIEKYSSQHFILET